MGNNRIVYCKDCKYGIKPRKGNIHPLKECIDCGINRKNFIKV